MGPRLCSELLAVGCIGVWLQPVQVPEEGDVDGWHERGVAIRLLLLVLLGYEWQPQPFVAAQGLLESITLAHAACVFEAGEGSCWRWSRW